MLFKCAILNQIVLIICGSNEVDRRRTPQHLLSLVDMTGESPASGATIRSNLMFHLLIDRPSAW